MNSPRKYVWLIDDSDIDQRLYRRLIAKSGVDWDVTMFTLAEEALDHLSNAAGMPVDLIFLDINMPRMNGFEFLETAEARFGCNFANVVVAMLTTSLDPTDRERAQAFEVVKEFINKPLTIEILHQIERQFLD